MANKDVESAVLPRARLINHSLFEMDAYTDPRTGKAGEPKYKVEVAFEDNEANYDAVMKILEDAAEAIWGDKAFVNGELREDIALPIIQGDDIAKKRERKGKPSDAYKGMLVIRADTKFNADGVEGVGGIAVYDEAVKRVTIDRRNEIYNGCYVEVAVRASGYVNNDGDDALKFYLQAVQKVGDGERLTSPADHSTLFKPVERQEGERRERRRRG